MPDRVSFAGIGLAYLEAYLENAILDALGTSGSTKSILADELGLTSPAKDEIVGAILASLQHEERVRRHGRKYWRLTEKDLRLGKKM